jgi:hypothetical protein
VKEYTVHRGMRQAWQRSDSARMHLRMSGPLAPLIRASVGDRQPEIDSFAAALRAHVEG